ncbi:putative ABC-type transport system, periplasmic component [Vibrio crassostreae]|uniref:SgrR family transcriptional regulator n=1 Tax=Vibrio crassostreae TaxID=246167 RepID=UPI001B3124A9|nr:SgrR family transcriptional regulator [Vibrio crassostreae]CAK2020966.1 putative ABC-type transport system, periplasmic component [Vibrio crassostreae]CAK2050075.1 putative ABC-type transport system, periplasmic component [Vibrio crassostreae]CAK2293265.1 putative ABC-type transport system, periplasmic component [Vibrio crassostreae]CAK2348577.1 putative ABC-type transport system, periplasmic component [Vibrio crassostreae]CAK2351852.1 putative ABC-type transport system, periplasmic compone
MGNLKRKLELYEKIFQAFGPGVSHCQVNQLATLLHVSERHVQTLLKAMTAQGWIEWQASSGRSKKAQLTCLVEPIEACYQYAQSQADSGNIEQVFNTLSFNGRNAGTELQAFLSSNNHSTQNVALIPFHRELEALHPQRVLRRTERFLVMQICQRLTAIRQEKLSGDLAYHWQHNEDATVWHFQVRNGAQFHNGRSLEIQDIVRCLSSLSRSKFWRRCYQHIVDVSAVTGDVIKVTLSEPDWHLPRLLARPEASIFEHTSDDKLIGSGAFALEIFSSKMLRLNRNNAYSHSTPILNQVELWVYPDWSQTKACAQNQVCVKMPEKTVAVNGASDSALQNFGSTFFKVQNPKLSKTAREFTVEDTSECQALFEQLSVSDDQKTNIEYGHYTATKDIALCSIIDENDTFSSWLSFFTRFPFEDLSLAAKMLNRIEQGIASIRREPNLDLAMNKLLELRHWLDETGIVVELKQEAFNLEVSEKIHGVQVNGFGWCELDKLWISHL